MISDVYGHFSTTSFFCQDPVRRQLILRALSMQGIERLICPGFDSLRAICAQGEISVDPGFVDIVCGEQAKSLLTECDDSFCLVIQDQWYPGLNLAELVRGLEKADFVCGNLLQDRNSDPTFWNEGPFFDVNGQLKNPCAPSDLYGIYSGAFCCRPDKLRKFWQDSRSMGKVSEDDQDLTGALYGQIVDGYRNFYHSHGPDQAEEWLEQDLKPCLFLDRDGVINKDVGYPYRREDFVFLSGVVSLIKTAKSCNYRVVVLTNQSGIARGLFEEDDLDLFHSVLQEALAEYCLSVDEIYTCPYHPSGSIPRYTKLSIDRKPLPGMAIRAMEKFPTRLKGSLMVGDRLSDEILLPGLQTVFLQGNYDLCGRKQNTFYDYESLSNFLLDCFHKSK